MPTQHTILVPISSAPASLEAVAVAALLSKQKKSRIYVLHVIEVNRTLPLTAELEPEARRGEQFLRRAEEVAAAAGVHVSGELLQAREAGQAIVEEAMDRGVDSIVMGVGYRQLIGGAIQMGHTADFVLRNARCQVLLVRQALDKNPRDHE